MSVIACHKCKQYIRADDQTFVGQKAIKIFKQKHLNHPTTNASVIDVEKEYVDLTGKEEKQEKKP